MVTERQWRDVVSIVRVQGSQLDRDQLLDDARSVGLADLVARLLADVGRRDERR